MIRFFLSGKKFVCLLFCASCFLINQSEISAQKQRERAALPTLNSTKSSTTKTKKTIEAVVIEENLAVLRFDPSFTALPLQRLKNGQTILIVGEKSADGIVFYRAELPPDKTGWIQADAVAVGTRDGDDQRLLKLIRASNDFDKIELVSIFLENFPNSVFRPMILLLFGDLAQEAAEKLSREAKRHFIETESFQALGAPAYSYYLNYNGLDRYRRTGVNFAFNRATLQFHCDGASWREILKKYPNSAEAVEARKRLSSLEIALK